MYDLALLVHILAATVWTGGHLVLALTILPRALRENDIAFLSRFEEGYEKIGIPALVLQVLSGLYLSLRWLPEWSQWLDFANPVSRIVTIKLILLGCTLALAADARFRLIPKLSPDNIRPLAWHIVPVTVVSVLFVIAGVSFRTGWL